MGHSFSHLIGCLAAWLLGWIVRRASTYERRAGGLDTVFLSAHRSEETSPAGNLASFAVYPVALTGTQVTAYRNAVAGGSMPKSDSGGQRH